MMLGVANPLNCKYFESTVLPHVATMQYKKMQRSRTSHCAQEIEAIYYIKVSSFSLAI